MNALVVGPSASGKSTLIEEGFPEYKHLDVVDYFGDELPAPNDFRAFLNAYETLADTINRETRSRSLLAVEVALDWPYRTLPPVIEALKSGVTTQVIPVWAPRDACLQNNRVRGDCGGRQAPEELIYRHHRHDLGRVAGWLMKALDPGCP